MSAAQLDKAAYDKYKFILHRFKFLSESERNDLFQKCLAACSYDSEIGDRIKRLQRRIREIDDELRGLTDERKHY